MTGGAQLRHYAAAVAIVRRLEVANRSWTAIDFEPWHALQRALHLARQRVADLLVCSDVSPRDVPAGPPRRGQTEDTAASSHDEP